ncbi:MAG: enoyl-CoA hydratase/isomerase family protein [Deltaproteobacteria bacterium]|nr:enoyl-CoA hydratase/isomerase family protein [Deltaproteobacteria bacterium]
MNYESIRLEVNERVATLTLNRPERMNAWNQSMEREIQDALRRCDQDDQVRAVVVTGAGKAFCAGADLAGGGQTFQGRPADLTAGQICPWDLRKPVIAAINGHAVGVGITFAMSCDVRYIAEDAKISFAFVRRGVIPGFGSHATVARVAGLSCAAELMMSGRTIRGAEAAELRLASRALPAEEVLPAALALARDIAENAAPVAVAIVKQLLWQNTPITPSEMKRREDRLFAWIGGQADAREGVEAFLQKRPPRWSMSASRDLPDALD